jgi:hypothetical protein
VAQAVVLRHAHGGRLLAVVNAHLIMSGLAAQVRTLQAYLILSALQEWVAGLRLGAECSVVFCGDLNVYARTDDVMKLLAGDGVSASSYQWIAGRNIGRRPTRERRCTATVSRAQTCENPALEGSEHCWDHTCSFCQKPKMREYQRTCHSCGADGAIASQPTPPPPDGPFFAVELACPVAGGLINAYEAVTGTPILFAVPFRPTTGAPLTTSPWSSGLWEECRDHIWCSRDMRATAALPPPPPESMRGLPSLYWPSDHIALCADLEWTAEQAVAPAKRQKSDPGRPPAAAPKPHEQRSWGETSLKRALP